MLERFRSSIATARERGGEVVRAALGLPPTITLDALPGWGGYAPIQWRQDTGSKFANGFGPTELLTADYWTLRARSSQLFETNLYARGLIRRLVTNEITMGLHLEALPFEKLLGREEDALAEWSEDVETRFELWGNDPWLCDHYEQHTFGQLQIQARMEALIDGDVLVVLRQFSPTQLPRIQLIKGSSVQTPFLAPNSLAKGHRVIEGVELDAQGRQVAYWIQQTDGTSKRLPASGEKSGRRIAWLMYGTDKRLDNVRGKPLLSLMLQSVRELDRYRDSTQRKAVINSMLAAFIKKTQRNIDSGTGFLGGAVKRGVGVTTDAAGVPRTFNTAGMIPGVVIDELAYGEEPVAFQTQGTLDSFPEFEKAIIITIAWAHEIPPEILLLSFSSNYSASQAAINEFKLYLQKVRTLFGTQFNQKIYVEWVVAMALTGKIQAGELVESWRDPKLYDVFAAWTNSDWSGNIKPAMDPLKQAEAYEKMVEIGAITRDRMARELTGMKYTTVVKQLVRENKLLAVARKIMAEIDAKVAPAPASGNKRGNDQGNDDDEASGHTLHAA